MPCAVNGIAIAGHEEISRFVLNMCTLCYSCYDTSLATINSIKRRVFRLKVPQQVLESSGLDFIRMDLQSHSDDTSV